MADWKKASIAAAGIFVIAVSLAFSFPTRNTYLVTPGLWILWTATGGPHGSGLSGRFALLGIPMLVGSNFALYWIVAYTAVKLYKQFRGHHA